LDRRLTEANIDDYIDPNSNSNTSVEG
jgi:hypothetical protein